MAANKFVAVFLVFVVFVAAVQPSTAGDDHVETTGFSIDNNPYDAIYKSCFNTCKNECGLQGVGSSACEVKCDNDCAAKEVAEKLANRP